VDLLKIHESRAGGNRHDMPYHVRDVAEAVEHDLNIGALTYERYFRQYDMLSVYGSVQDLTRDSYYGANRSLADYGSTTDLTYNIGTQYKYHFEHSSIIVGTELIAEHLVDKKLGYADYDNAVIADGAIAEVPYTDNTTVSDQVSQTTGAFAQYDIRFERFRLAVGGRADHYRIRDHQGANADKTGTVFIPRVNLMYNITDYLQARAGYSQGYRAPQVFDEDLHIETSGSRMVINVNDPDLSQESSHSYMFSLDFNRLIGTIYTGFLAEAFYTRLDHPFVNEIGTPDEHGTVLYTRVNADGGASVQGVNMELKLKPLRMLELSSGMTVQTSHYDEAQEFGEKRFFRTPDSYGFFAADWDFAKSFCLSATGTYTGEMLVPYFGPNTDPEAGELRVSDRFYDLGMKLEYTKRTDEADISLFGGVKNIFNSFQSDHDTGIDRDPAYMYGPGLPRTVYVGVKVGNLL
jgi:outer membrane receptor for ferrienterochelin and colicins